MGKYDHFQRPAKLLTPMGLFHFICSVDLTVSCFHKHRSGEIVNSGSQRKSKVQSTLNLRMFKCLICRIIVLLPIAIYAWLQTRQYQTKTCRAHVY